jgi:PIN domain nuclease of toxin-antitoxin system
LKYLFDTHAWLWLLLAPERVGQKTRALVSSGKHDFDRLLVAQASVDDLTPIISGDEAIARYAIRVVDPGD